MAFHEIRFPLRLALGASGGPVRRTDIVSLTNGREVRNRRWRDSRRVYEVGSGIRSLADLRAVIDFFEARGGALHGFRFHDPADFSSARPGSKASATDQTIGFGDGTKAAFQLVKTYGDSAATWTRTIAKPVQGTVSLAVGGKPMAEGPDYRLDLATGILVFQPGRIPAAQQAVTAGFEFDVPVRFAADRIEISLQAFQAGRIPTIPLMEIQP